MLRVVPLLTEGDPVTAPQFIIYSTAPRRAIGEDGAAYFVKGMAEPAVAFAELAGCLLARSAGLPTPEPVVCAFDGRVGSGSKEAADIGRDIQPMLRNRRPVDNFHDLYAVVVVDAWLGNHDRNMGNVVAASTAPGRVQFQMIDFQKSATLGPHPIMTTAQVSPRDIWPSGDLGRAIREGRPLVPPTAALENVRRRSRDEISALVQSVVSHIGDPGWAGGSVELLAARAEKIAEIAGEVWAQS